MEYKWIWLNNDVSRGEYSIYIYFDMVSLNGNYKYVCHETFFRLVRLTRALNYSIYTYVYIICECVAD